MAMEKYKCVCKENEIADSNYNGMVILLDNGHASSTPRKKKSKI